MAVLPIEDHIDTAHRRPDRIKIHIVRNHPEMLVREIALEVDHGIVMIDTNTLPPFNAEPEIHFEPTSIADSH